MDGHRLIVRATRLGTGPMIVMLPALSSMSTRREMQPLQVQLAPEFSTVALDWPGLGEGRKPFLDWRPRIYEKFLEYLLSRLTPNPFAIVAAGHGAGYVINHFAHDVTCGASLVCLSPTWRGPLPTMLKRHRPWFRTLTRLIDRPRIGPMLYRLNVNRFVVGMMARGHVYENPDWLHGERLRAKLALTCAAGARHGSARFVTGGLDPFESRERFLEAAAQIKVPVLNVFADAAPPKSRREMEALSELAHVQTVRVPRGRLSFYEEFPDQAAKVIRSFLRGD